MDLHDFIIVKDGLEWFCYWKLWTCMILSLDYINSKTKKANNSRNIQNIFFQLIAFERAHKIMYISVK